MRFRERFLVLRVDRPDRPEPVKRWRDGRQRSSQPLRARDGRDAARAGRGGPPAVANAAAQGYVALGMARPPTGPARLAARHDGTRGDPSGGAAARRQAPGVAARGGGSSDAGARALNCDLIPPAAGDHCLPPRAHAFMPGQSSHPKQRRGIADDVFVLQREHGLAVAIVVSGDVALGQVNSFRVRQRAVSQSRYAVRASFDCAHRASPTIRSAPPLHIVARPGQITGESWRDYLPRVVLALVHTARERRDASSPGLRDWHRLSTPDAGIVGGSDVQICRGLHNVVRRQGGSAAASNQARICSTWDFARSTTRTDEPNRRGFVVFRGRHRWRGRMGQPRQTATLWSMGAAQSRRRRPLS
jgi:hypothetical protein